MSTKIYTFQSLFGSTLLLENTTTTLNKIEIPIIQRDYAQGRKTKEVNRVRERFLNALFKAIVQNERITLDFIYGDVSDEGVLIPLDGQQRLTTLFLLHWYIAKKENIEKNEYEFLNHFTYHTRFSSRDFCKELVKFLPDFRKQNISETIKDQHWYPYQWKNDPTIQSMLVMIDAIHEKFKNENNLWKSLVYDKNITFYFLPLSEMGLTDDLYIKMNSRGKPLTPFEHFKAEFEEIIKEHSEKLSTEINHKFDIEWTDMLFPFRGDNNIIDDEFMRYFRFISDIICYQSEIGFEKDEFKLAKILYGKIKSDDDEHKNKTDEEIAKANKIAEKNIQYFVSAFDCWDNLEIEAFFTKFFSKHAYEQSKVKLYQDDLNVFKECLDNYGEYKGRNRSFPLNKTLLLFSIITYRLNSDRVSENEFRRRIRILRNLIENSSFEIRDDRMNILLSECETIILTGTIPTTEKGDLGFNVRQKNEEIEKTAWLEINTHLEDEMFHLEDHHLLKGCIAIVGIENYNHFKKFRLLFNNCSKDNINRAMLSIDDFSQAVSWRRQLGAKINDSVWINLFHPSKQRQGFEKTYQVLNSLLAKLDERDITNENLEEISNEYLSNSDTLKDWRYYFVKYSAMRDGNFGMYYWKDQTATPYEVFMMNTEISIGGKNWNPFHYTLKKDDRFKGKLTLGDYAFNEDELIINNSPYKIKCFNDKYVVYYNELPTEYPIKQKNNVDIEDRIEKGREIIMQLINNMNKAVESYTEAVLS